MNKETEVTRIQESITYCPDTGQLFWKLDRPATHFKRPQEYKRYLNNNAGKPVICSLKSGAYLNFRLGYQHYEVHRIAFVCVLGRFPKEQVDHKNGDTLNNSWINLREVPQVINARNRKKPTNNTSGVTGVSWHKGKQKWIARISHENKEIQLGAFVDKDVAVAARNSYLANNPLLGYTHDHGIR